VAIAEGVEDSAAIDMLKGMGCDEAQGFHLGVPCPPEELFDAETHSGGRPDELTAWSDAIRGDELAAAGTGLGLGHGL
jgi:EAL domain-containing protein (putative c-di-GMP-specific phosphodiesterase class I)